MTNPMFNPPQNYSGVTIQISNPTVNANPAISGYRVNEPGYVTCPQSYCCNTQYAPPVLLQDNNAQNKDTGYPNAYPAQYYLNNYNYPVNTETGTTDNSDKITKSKVEKEQYVEKINNDAVSTEKSAGEPYSADNNLSSDASQSAVLRHYDTGKTEKDNDMSKSTSIIGDIDEREIQMQEEKKNTKETKIVALTDEYIKSLENYLNNPNDEIRLMASKEILTRLDEDKDRYDDAALNALLNKMLQDPSKLVRIAALSAFGSQLASGNDYTVKLLQNIQSNPSADKEDVLQAADILLKMSAGVEVKNIPVPQDNGKK